MTTATVTRIDLPKLLAVDAALLLVAAAVAAGLGAGVVAIVLAVLGVDLGIAAEIVQRRRR
jgi:hypothetical protein